MKLNNRSLKVTTMLTYTIGALNRRYLLNGALKITYSPRKPTNRNGWLVSGRKSWIFLDHKINSTDA